MRKELIKELEEAKKELKEARLELLKERTLETIKIVIVSIPLVLSGGFTLNCGRKLFFEKEIEKPYVIEQVYDNEGNTSTIQIKDEEEHTNTLTTYNSYTKNNDGTYTREYKVYDISEIPSDKIKKCVDQYNLDIDLKTISSGIETTNKINEEENKYRMIVRTYEEDKNNTYTIEKTKSDKNRDFGKFIISIALGAAALKLSMAIASVTAPNFYYDDHMYRKDVKKAKEKVKSIKKR